MLVLGILGSVYVSNVHNFHHWYSDFSCQAKGKPAIWGLQHQLTVRSVTLTTFIPICLSARRRATCGEYCDTVDG